MRIAASIPLTLLTLGLAATTSVSAQQTPPDSARLAEVERRMEALTREIEALRLGRDVVEADASVLGFGPAASKVYRVNQGVSLGGYGEFLYENYAAEREDGTPASSRDRFDALRAILYVGYKFNDRILFNSEIEIEHADEIYLEFAYIDYLLNDGLGVRAGMLLSPMGFLNELHEPSLFLGTERPVTESRIIPSTWRENGIGVFGGNDAVAWRAYVLNSFDGSGFNGSGLRGGRQKGGHALAEDMGVVGRLDYVGTLGLTLGASAFYGQTAQNRELVGEPVDGGVFIWDLHADYKARGFDLRALVAGAAVGDAAALNELNGLAGSDGVGESMLGWYVQAGYDVLRGTASTHQLVPYVRYEQVNTQRTVAQGFEANPANDLTVLALGAAWKPVPQVVAKAGYQIHTNEARTGVNQFNVQLGWLF